MMRPALAVTGLATALLLACAAPARETTLPPQPAGTSVAQALPTPDKYHPMNAAASPALLPGARDAGARVLTFLSTVSFTAAFTPAGIRHAMGVTLGPDPNNDPGWAIYHSPDLGKGWSYWVQFAAGEATLKPGFRFWFDHPNLALEGATFGQLSTWLAGMVGDSPARRVVPKETKTRTEKSQCLFIIARWCSELRLLTRPNCKAPTRATLTSGARRQRATKTAT